VAIGYAFQNLVIATVTSVIEPLLIKLLMLTHLNDVYDFARFLSPEKNVMNFTVFVSNVITFIICVITVYYINDIFTVL
jgi:large-conductance mechanosensitive channel